MKMVYVDNNATTAIAPEVLEAMQPYFTSEYYNPSSMYTVARGPANAIQSARQTVARCLGGIDPDQLLFTGSATESNNAALFGTAQANPSRRHIITTAVEHPSVLEIGKELVRRGYDVTFLPVDRNGELQVRDFVRALRSDTLLVSIMMANNETGVCYPVGRLAGIAKETDSGIVFHTDATQAVGKVPVDLVHDLRYIDLLSFSGHKIYAPKGVGVLFIRRDTRWQPYLLGGHQEGGRRGGTENVPAIVGLAKACELAAAGIVEEQTRIRHLRDKLQAALEERIPGLEINGRGAADRLPNTLNLAVHGIEGEAILYELSRHGICASSGSACTSGSLEPSHVLKAMQVPFTAIHGSVRISLGRYNDEADIERIIEVLPEVVASLRKLSPYWDNRRNCLKV